MTRAERAAEQVKKAQAKRAAQQLRAQQQDAASAVKVRQAKTAQYHEMQKALARRRYTVGDLAERAGLFTWDDATLRDLFALVATLGPDPVRGLSVFLAEKRLTAPSDIPSDSCTEPEGKFRTPLLETSEESERSEVTKKGLAAAGVFAQG